MFEGLLSDLLNRVLGEYVKDEINAANLSASIYSGNLVLTELELKPEALDVLQLPVTLRRGYLGRVEPVFWALPHASAAAASIRAPHCGALSPGCVHTALLLRCCAAPQSPQPPARV